MTHQGEAKTQEENQNPEGEVKECSRKKKIIIGVSVVAGVLLLALTIGLIVRFVQREQYSSEFVSEYVIPGTN